MPVKRVSIQWSSPGQYGKGTIFIDVSEADGKVLGKAFKIAAPMLAAFTEVITRLILAVGSLDKAEREQLMARVKAGESPLNYLRSVGIKPEALVDIKIKWPSDEEIDQIFERDKS